MPPLVLILALLFSDLVAAAAAPLRLHSAFSSHMVLQRAPQQAVMWGYSEPGRTITVQLDSNNVTSTTVTSVGSWSVKLPATEASFNRTIGVSDGNATVTLTNVAFGDVYLCSGQSNMQIVLDYSFGGAEAIASASHYSNLRLFSLYQSYSATPLDELSTANIAYSPDSWVLPSAATLQFAQDPSNVYGYFSAVCYWTGMYVSDSLNGTVPIGLVQASYGGTIVEAWTSLDTVNTCGPLTYPPGGSSPLHSAAACYNAMIHPLLPMRSAAVLWYQV